MMSTDDVLRVALEIIHAIVRAVDARRVPMALHLLEVLDETRPAREAILARDHVLRIGKLQLVRLTISQGDGMHVSDALQSIRTARVDLLEERLRFLALVLETWRGWERARVRRNRIAAFAGGAGHTTSFRLDPCPPRGSEKRLSCHGTARASDGTIPSRGPEALRSAPSENLTPLSSRAKRGISARYLGPSKSDDVIDGPLPK